jgi:pyruvate dehydrogenase E1 component
MPALPGVEEDDADKQDAVRSGVLAGAYRFAAPAEPERASPEPNGRRRNGRNGRNGGNGSGSGSRATLLFSGSSWRAVADARDLLAADWGIAADSWSVTSYTELRREALSVERWNRLHPGEPPRTPYITRVLGDQDGPVIAVTDYMRAVPDQVSRFVDRRFVSLGTDGFGRSDTREALRSYFEVDAAHVVLAVLAALADAGDGKPDDVADAISRYGLETEKPDPWTL